MNDTPGRGCRSIRRYLARTARSGLPPRVRKHLSGVVFLVFLGLYTATLLPGVLPADSGEFQWVTATAGVAHPPGFPFYTILGWLTSRMPLGSTAAWRVNFLSAVTAAATVALVFSAGRELTDSVLGGLVAALTLGSATTFWATATKASIRPLTAFFTALCLFALLRHASQEHDDQRPGRDHYLVLFSLSLSLGLTHHPSLAFPGAVFVLYLVLVDPDLLRQPSRWLRPIVALLPGLLVLAYLPLRGSPDLTTTTDFLDHVLARGFRGDMFALDLFSRSVLLPTLFRFQFNHVILVGMFLGALLLLWHDRKLALLLIGSALVHTLVTLTYDAPQTVEYEMPAYVSLALLLAVPFGYLSDLRHLVSGCRSFVATLKTAALFLGQLVGVVFLIASIVNLTARFSSYHRLSRSRDTHDYVQTVLSGAPQGAVILSNWHWFTPLRYAQQIEGLRPDVTIEYVAPRGEPLAQTWVRRIEDHVADRAVIVARAFEPAYSALPYALEPLGEAFLVRSQPRTEVPSGMTTLDTVLGSQIKMLGYRLASAEIQPAQPISVILAWSPADLPDTEIALFAQLIGPNGELRSAAEDPRHAPDTLSVGEVVVDRLVVYPQLHAPPGSYTLVVGAYSPEGRLTTAEGSDYVALTTVRLRPSTTRPVTEHPRLVRLAGGPTLIGVDYDVGPEGTVRTYLHWAGPGELTQVQVLGAPDVPTSTTSVPPLLRGQYATVAVDHPEVPSRLMVADEGNRRWNLLFSGPVRLPAPGPVEVYVPLGDAVVLTGAGRPSDLEPGTEATLALRFRSQRPLQRDYIVSTSLTGLKADGSWAWRVSHDTVPALGAIPTLKWIRGSSVIDPHRMQVPDDAPAVPVLGSMLVYDHFTQRSLPNLDERRALVVELGTWSFSP